MWLCVHSSTHIDKECQFNFRLELPHVKTWILNKSSKGKPKQSVGATIKVSPLSIISEHVKDLTIKMATPTMVIPHYKQHLLSRCVTEINKNSRWLSDRNTWSCETRWAKITWTSLRTEFLKTCGQRSTSEPVYVQSSY